MNYYDSAIDTIDDEQLVKVYIDEFELFDGNFRELNKHLELNKLLRDCLIDHMSAESNYLILKLVKE